MLDAGSAGGLVGGGAMIAGNHPDVETKIAQTPDSLGGFRLVLIGDFDGACHGAIHGHLDSGLADHDFAAVNHGTHAKTSSSRKCAGFGERDAARGGSLENGFRQ